MRKRWLAAALVLMVTVIATATAVAYHTPAGVHLTSRLNPNVRVVWVLDEVDPDRLPSVVGDSYADVRGEILARWERSGVVAFVVKRVAPSGPCTPSAVTEQVPGTMRLCLGEPFGPERGWATAANETPWMGDESPDEHYTAGIVGIVADRVGDAFGLRLVLCHEIGHTLGLGHRTEGTSCMSSLNAYPDRHDLEALRALYDHVDV